MNEPINTDLDFTNRKVIVRNVLKFVRPKAMQASIDSWIEGTDLKVCKTKKPPKSNWIVLTFEKEEMVEPFLKIINEGKHLNEKGGVLRANRASDRDDSELGKRGRGRDRNDHKNKRCRTETVKTSDEIRDAITPLWRISYDDQLDRKAKLIVNKCLVKLLNEVKTKIKKLQKEKANKRQIEVFDWIKNRIPMANILCAPQHFEYRNKCELTFGYSHSYAKKEENGEKKEKDSYSKESIETSEQELPQDKISESQVIVETSPQEDKVREIVKTPAVGFMAGGWAGGVSSPHCLQNIPDVVCGIADVINEFLKTSSIPPYQSRQHRGIWRHVTIRTSERTKQCMIVICHAPSKGGAGARDDGSDDYSAIFESEKERLVKLLSGKIPQPKRDYPSNAEKISIEDDSPYCDISVTSLYFQEYDGLSSPSPEHPVQHVFGLEHIEESLLQCKFEISPGAFFQVTTEGAEVLYSVVVEKLKEVTKDPNQTVLFDVCCGTGTIGLTCLKEGAVGKVVGIDISSPAIANACTNAQKNGFSSTDGTTKFIASRAELAMRKEINEVPSGSPMVAVVDPAREGLHQEVIKALRNEKEIKRIIYVSCNPTGSLVKDAGLLCGPTTKRYCGLPFKPTSAQPVDMFPLTEHCEMVMVFDRMSQEEYDMSSEGSQKKEPDANQTEPSVDEKELKDPSTEGTPMDKKVSPN